MDGQLLSFPGRWPVRGFSTSTVRSSLEGSRSGSSEIHRFSSHDVKLQIEDIASPFAKGATLIASNLHDSLHVPIELDALLMAHDALQTTCRWCRCDETGQCQKVMRLPLLGDCFAHLSSGDTLSPGMFCSSTYHARLSTHVYGLCYFSTSLPDINWSREYLFQVPISLCLVCYSIEIFMAFRTEAFDLRSYCQHIGKACQR